MKLAEGALVQYEWKQYLLEKVPQQRIKPRDDVRRTQQENGHLQTKWETSTRTLKDVSASEHCG